MPKQRKPRVPEMYDPMQEIAAAGEAAGDKVKKAAKYTEADIIWNDRETLVAKGNQYENDVWNHGPAQLEFMVVAYQMLVKVAELMGESSKKVSRVRIGFIKGTKNVIVKPTQSDDADGLEVNKYGSSYWVNAISVLGPAKLTVDSGYRERYTVSIIGADMPGGPALMINLGKSQDRVFEGGGKKAQATPPAPAPTTTSFKASKQQIERANSSATPASEPDTPEEV